MMIMDGLNEIEHWKIHVRIAKNLDKWIIPLWNVVSSFCRSILGKLTTDLQSPDEVEWENQM